MSTLFCKRCGGVLPVTVSEDGNRLLLPGGVEIRHKVTLYCPCGTARDFVPARRRQLRD